MPMVWREQDDHEQDDVGRQHVCPCVSPSVNPSVNPKCEQKPTRRAARLPDKADWTTRGNRRFVIDRLGQVGVCWQRRQRRALPGSTSPPLLAQFGCGAKGRQKKASLRHRSC